MRKSFWKRMLLTASVVLFLPLFSCNRQDDGLPSDVKVDSYGKLQVIPSPKQVEGVRKNGEYPLVRYRAALSCQEEAWKNASAAFCEYVNLLHQVDLTMSSEGGIELVLDDTLEEGSYRISCGKTVRLSAADETGLQAGFATLLQMMQKKDQDLLLPYITIQDKGDSSYRGLMIDLARNWHEMDLIYRYVDLCYFYKINILHLHFTDSESYTLPSAAYPDLSTKNRHYTREQIDALVTYAHDRGVTLVPEIETPGHCQSFADAYPKLFGKNGIMCEHEEVFEALDVLFDELCEMFPYSPYIHIGGDEAAINNWLNCKKCVSYAEEHGLFVSGDRKLTTEKMYAHFVQRVADAVFRNGRQPIVWEGFSKEVNDLVSKDVMVISWENHYQSTQDLLAAGFPIINCAWQPMYIVPPDTGWSDEEILDWSIYYWDHWWDQSSALGGFTVEPTDQVKGGQISVWGDPANGVNQEYLMVLQRIPALAEKTWTIDSTRELEEFRESYRNTRSIFLPIYQQAVADDGRTMINQFGSGADQSGLSKFGTEDNTVLGSCFEVWEGAFSGVSLSDFSFSEPGSCSVYVWKDNYQKTLRSDPVFRCDIADKEGWTQGESYNILFPDQLEPGRYLVVLEGGVMSVWAHNVYGGVMTFVNGEAYTTGTLKLRSIVN